jgi:hypothetical protein
MSVYQKLSEARAKFHSLQLKKTGHNKFAGYYYFELGDFLIPALQVFKECGLLAVVSFTADVASMTIIDLEDGSQHVITSPMGSAALKGCHEVQNIGAVETYQRRYLWVAALEIVEHDALDAVTGSDKGAPEAKPNTPTQQTHDAYQALPVDLQTWIADLAHEVTKLVAKEGAEQGRAHIEDQMRDAENIDDLKMALWSQLDPKTRAALKKKA